MTRRLPHREDEDQDGDERRCRRHPEDRPDVVVEERHEENGKKRPRHRARRVERLTQSVGSPPLFWRYDVGDQRIARCAANALADAVDEACGENRVHCRRQRKERLRQRRETVADDGEQLTLAEPVAEGAGKNLGDGRGRLRRAFDEADRDHARAESRDEKDGQQRVHEFRRHVHEETDEAERPDACGQAAHDASTCAGRAHVVHHTRPSTKKTAMIPPADSAKSASAGFSPAMRPAKPSV